MRRPIVMLIVFAVSLLVAGCSGGSAITMPNVVGKGLDVAISDVKRAGIDKQVEVLGGGMLGVVDKSNWIVCSQEPQNGAKVSSAPRLTVGRTCSNGETPSNGPSTEPAKNPGQSTPTETASAAAPGPEQTLTAENNQDLAALLAGSASGGEMVEAFAAKYKGKNIEFDGNIATMSNHGSSKTRYDILIAVGSSTSKKTGPNFQFQDVNIISDLHLTGANVPDSIGKGQNLHITATVEDYNRTQELFFLKPVSTKVR